MNKNKIIPKFVLVDTSSILVIGSIGIGAKPFGVCYASLHRRIAVRSYKSKAVCFCFTLLPFRERLRFPSTPLLSSTNTSNAKFGLKQYIINGYAINSEKITVDRFLNLEKDDMQNIKKLMPNNKIKLQQGAFYNGQIYDAYAFINDLLKKRW